MKHLAAILCLGAAILLFAGPLRCRAAVLEAPQSAAQTPEITEADAVYRFTLRAPEAAAYETYRRENYETVSKSYTDEQIAASDAAWLLYPVAVLCEVKTGQAGTYTPAAAFAPAAAGTAEVSLTKDILPALAAADLYTDNAFSFSLAFSVAVRMQGTWRPLSPRGEDFVYECPATVHIDYVLPAGTDNENPAFLFAPVTEPLTLQNPTLPGHVFTGWQTEGGLYVDTVFPGAAGTRLYARFSPCVYRVNYVLTTRPGYSFNRVSNTDNPKTHTYGTAEPLYAVKAPVGYVCAGWYRDRDFTGKNVTEIAADTLGDVLLYARWLTEAEAEEEAALAAGWGDLNDDGAVTAADARLALRSAVGLETLPPAVIARADFAKLGKLNASSARTLLRVAVGLDRMADILKQHGLM